KWNRSGKRRQESFDGQAVAAFKGVVHIGHKLVLVELSGFRIGRKTAAGWQDNLRIRDSKLTIRQFGVQEGNGRGIDIRTISCDRSSPTHTTLSSELRPQCSR